ncbi:MAG: alginate export family protein [Proteobacteria bacterium]|nr:alginate export family protein [Pseudomonadota bacterium]
MNIKNCIALASLMVGFSLSAQAYEAYDYKTQTSKENNSNKSSNKSSKAATIIDALKQGKPYLQLNYRYEFVRDKDAQKDANASTLLTVLGYDSAEFKGFSGKLEFQDISVIGSKRYNDGFNDDNNNRATVGDVAGTSVNQAYINWKAPKATNIRAGIQKIAFDNQRFVGEAAWRQSGQTFEAVRVSNQYFKNLTLNYAFIDTINRAAPDSRGITQYDDNNIHLFNIAYDIPEHVKISIYDYLIDIDEAPSSSSKSQGIRVASHQYKFDDGFTASYQLEFAKQKDYGNNPKNYSTDYILAEANIGYEQFDSRIGLERLGADRKGGSFQTPIAARHRVNGWADRFLTTPAQGLLDFYLAAGYRTKTSNKIINNIYSQFTFHNFSSRRDNIDLGEEYDFIIKKDFEKYFNVGLKAAHFRSSDSTAFSNITRIMFFTGLKL